MALRRPSSGYQVALALVALGMIALLLASLSSFWNMSLAGGPLLLLSVAGVAFGWLWWWSPRLGGGLTAGVAILGALLSRRIPFLVVGLRSLSRETTALLDHLSAGEMDATFGVNLGMAMLVAVALLAGLLIIPEGFGRGKAFWSIAGGLLLFGVQWSWYFEPSAPYFMGFLMLALTYWTLGQAAMRVAHWEASGRHIGIRSHLAAPLAAVLAASVMGAVLPHRFAPIHLGEMAESVQDIWPVLKQLRGGGAGSLGGRFSLAATGFSSEMGLLGGPVKPDDRIALHVSPQAPLNQTLYLRGATYLEYTGKSWEPGDSQPVKTNEDGTLPTTYAKEALSELYSAKITPALGFGKTVFTLLEPSRVEGLPAGYEADSDWNLIANQTVTRSSSYEVHSRLPKYSAQQIRTLTGDVHGTVDDAYLQLPDSVPDRVYMLTMDLTGRIPHPYDKAVALESFLRGLSYDLNVPAAPEGQDFVDYFLFDLQGRGYCIYSASAMVVMLREVGIPSRLVEGFALPAATEMTLNAEGEPTYAVRNSQAHAWVEAYFPGYGWVTFDPTPRDDLPLIARDTPLPTSEDVASTTPGPGPASETPERAQRQIPEESDALGGGLDLPSDKSPQWPWFTLPLVLLAGLGLAAFLRLKKQDRLESSEERSLVQEVWEKSAGLLGRFDYGRKAHETPKEYAASLGEVVPSLKEPARRVAEDYAAARYGPTSEGLDAGAKGRAASFWKQVHEALLRRFGWRGYLLRRLWWRRVWWQRLRWRQR